MLQNNSHTILVVVELTGGNDFMNTLVPYSSGKYYDVRPNVFIDENSVLPINDQFGFHPSIGPLKQLYDEGNIALVQGVGYPNSSRSHFRALFDYQTCEPEKTVSEGWLGKVIKEIDPSQKNLLTGVNIGTVLPAAMVSHGASVTSVGDLDTYGLMNNVTESTQKDKTLQVFREMYASTVGTGPVEDYLRQTADVAIYGADTLKSAKDSYKSDIEYSGSQISKDLKDVAKILTANLGTQIFYVSQGGYDTHSNEIRDHAKRLSELSDAVVDFQMDLKEHSLEDNVLMLVYTEFGRRVKDNGSGTDHGSGGGAFLIGSRVAGGLFSEYPSLEPKDWAGGEDLHHTIDFRSVYASVLEQWFGMNANPIVGGTYEQIPIIDNSIRRLTNA